MEPSSWQIPLSAARPIRTPSSKLPCLAQVIFSEKTADDANDRPQTDQGSHFRSSIYGKSAGNVSHGAGGRCEAMIRGWGKWYPVESVQISLIGVGRQCLS